MGTVHSLKTNTTSSANYTSTSPRDVISQTGKYMLADVFNIVLDLDKSHGNRLVDAASGREYLDCFSFIASNPLGYNHPALSDPEFEKKLLRAAKLKPSNSDLWTVELADFVSTFARVGIPAELPHLFLVDGGTLAVENGLKAAFDWKVRLNFMRGMTQERGTKIIHFKEAFHGRSGYGLSLTNTADPKKTKFFPKFDWPRINNPKLSFPVTANVINQVKAEEDAAINEILSILKTEGDDVAAIIIEPIQGEGGDNHFRTEFHQALRRIADENDLLLIYDEVQSGVGLTGKFWAYQHYGMTPDILCFGKKMQVCGILASPRIDTIPNNVFVETSRINSTWGGNLTDMVRAERFLQVIEAEGLVQNAATVGKELLAGLEALEAKYPHLVSNSRGKGLMCAYDLPTTELRDKVTAGAMDRGLIVLKCGFRSVRLRPTLTFSSVEVKEVLGIFEEIIKTL
ncbi:L-lysine 6-transaminase [bacterium]|nr:L-lysine 6-transaminase [bacterium]